MARGASARGRDVGGVPQQPPKKKAVHLRYSEPSLHHQQQHPHHGVGPLHGNGRASKGAASGRLKTSSSSSSVLRDGGKTGRREKAGTRRRSSSGSIGVGRREDDESMVL